MPISATKKTILAMVLVGIASAGMAQAAEAVLEADAEPSQSTASNQPIEEITVMGERSLLSMRTQIVQEENNLYRLFNDLNSVDKFDIFCRSERSTSSYIPRRTCSPVFFSQLIRDSSRNAMTQIRYAFTDEGIDPALWQNGFDYLETESELRAQAAADFDALNQEIFRIAMENPDYLAVLLKIAELKALYRAARKERFGRG